MKILTESNQKKYLSEFNSDLAKEWNYKLNGTLLPENVTIGFDKKVWWTCKIGHNYQARIADRRKGNGCPYCSNRKVLSGYNDLITTFPELATEWHPYKNDILTPEMVTAGSHKKVWWLGKCGHEWQAQIIDRKAGNNCPICAGKILLVGYNDLATKNPELANEWNYERNGKTTPENIFPNSCKKYYWKCKRCGHEWQANINSRNGGRGCPNCAKGLQTSFAEQATFFYINKLFPDAINGDKHIGKELDIYIPSINVAIEYDGYRWHSLEKDICSDLEKNKLCEANNIKLFRLREDGCPVINDTLFLNVISCKHNDSLSLKNAIQTLLTKLNVKLSIDIESDKINILNQFTVARKNNSLSMKNPMLAKEFHPTKNGKLTSDNINYGSGNKIWWLCSNGHEWQAPVNIRHRGVGCPYCSNQRTLTGYNDLAFKRPDIASEWHPTKNGDLTPECVVSGSNRNVWWLGKCGHEWQAIISTRNKGFGACPYCSNTKVLSGFNDLETINPKLAKEWNYKLNGESKPNNFMPGSGKTVWWKCSNCNYEWKTRIVDRNNGRGCPNCKKKLI